MTMSSRNPTSGCISKKKMKEDIKKLSTSEYCSNKEDVEYVIIYIERERITIYIYIIIHTWGRRNCFPFATTWMYYRHILSEINHTDKDKQTYHWYVKFKMMNA